MSKVTLSLDSNAIINCRRKLPVKLISFFEVSEYPPKHLECLFLFNDRSFRVNIYPDEIRSQSTFLPWADYGHFWVGWWPDFSEYLKLYFPNWEQVIQKGDDSGMEIIIEQNIDNKAKINPIIRIEYKASLNYKITNNIDSNLTNENTKSEIKDIEDPTSPAERVEYTGNRLQRNVNFAEEIKELYNNTCQVCKVFLKTPIEGLGISEAAHIKAIGKPHDGPDTKANMFCLCPNHHAQFDRYTFYIDPETLEIIGLDEYKGESISINKKHKVNVEYFEYQKQQYLQNNEII